MILFASPAESCLFQVHLQYNDIIDTYDMYNFVCKSCIGSSASSPTEAKTRELCSFQRFSISNSNF